MKKTYTTPKVTRLGDIGQVTQAAPSGGWNGGGSSSDGSRSYSGGGSSHTS